MATLSSAILTRSTALPAWRLKREAERVTIAPPTGLLRLNDLPGDEEDFTDE